MKGNRNLVSSAFAPLLPRLWKLLCPTTTGDVFDVGQRRVAMAAFVGDQAACARARARARSLAAVPAPSSSSCGGGGAAACWSERERASRERVAAACPAARRRRRRQVGRSAPLSVASLLCVCAWLWRWRRRRRHIPSSSSMARGGARLPFPLMQSPLCARDATRAAATVASEPPDPPPRAPTTTRSRRGRATARRRRRQRRSPRPRQLGRDRDAESEQAARARPGGTCEERKAGSRARSCPISSSPLCSASSAARLVWPGSRAAIDDRLAPEDVVDAGRVQEHERHPDEREDISGALERVVGRSGVD